MNLLYNLITMTITGSIIFLLLKLSELITKHHFNAAWHYGNIKWVLLFFCIPFGKIIRFIVSDSILGRVATTSGNIDSRYSLGISKSIIQKTKLADQVILYKCLLTIWILVMGILLIRQTFCYLKFRYIIAHNKKEAGKELQQIVNMCGERLGISKPIKLYLNDFIDTPMLIGFFQPIILIPPDRLVIKNAEYVLTHELIHYKNKDLIVKIIKMFICTLHWFNPFVYLLSKDVDKWCEYTCDEKNVMNLSYDMKKQYGLAILETISTMPIQGAKFGTPFLLPKQDLKERLKFMLDVKKMKKKTQAASIVFAISLLCFGMATAFAEEGKKGNSIKESSLASATTNETKDFFYKVSYSKDLTTDNTYVEAETQN